MLYLDLLDPDSILGEVIWEDYPLEECSKPLTKPQRAIAEYLMQFGYLAHKINFRYAQINKVYWNLVGRGIARFGYGPVNSTLRMNGFMPIWSDPIM